MKKITSILLIIILALSMAGCSAGNTKVKITTGLSSKELFKIGDQTCFKSEALVYATAQKKLIEDAYGSEIWNVSKGDVTVKEYVQDSLKDFLAQLKCIHQMADDNQITLTDQEKTLANSCTEEYMKNLTKEEQDSLGVDKESIQRIYEEYILYNKVETELTNDKVEQISDNDARIMQVNMIVLSKEKTAKSVLKKAKAGEDFEKLAKKYSEDSQIQYALSRELFGEDFSNQVFDLEKGQISDMIKSNGKYYIVSCIDDYDKEATSEHKAELEKEKRQEIFDKLYKEYIDKLSAQFNKSVWKQIDMETIPSVKKADFFGIYENLTATN